MFFEIRKEHVKVKAQMNVADCNGFVIIMIMIVNDTFINLFGNRSEIWVTRFRPVE